MKKFALITICFAVLCIAAGGAVADMLPPGQTTLVYLHYGNRHDQRRRPYPVFL